MNEIRETVAQLLYTVARLNYDVIHDAHDAQSFARDLGKVQDYIDLLKLRKADLRSK